MRRLVLCWLSLLLAALNASPVWAEKGAERRVALVIGNARYGSAGVLTNPENDARLIADTLRSVGFTLIGGGAQLNLGDDKFRRTVKQFADQIQGADVALFYYAGHGVAIAGGNYLVPTDADLNRKADADFLLDINLVLHQMQEAGTRLNVVVLDACRNDPFEGARSMAIAKGLAVEEERMRGAAVGPTKGGLAQMTTPSGTVISFATQPGQTAADGAGGDSPYTTALADVVKVPGLSILDVFDEVGRRVLEATKENARPQIPWVSYSALRGKFYFVSSSGSGDSVAISTPTRPPAAGKVPAGVPAEVQIAQKYEEKARLAALEQQSNAKDDIVARAPADIGPLSTDAEHSLKALQRFKECANCPEMVTLPAGTYVMGSPPREAGRETEEGPQQQVTFNRMFAVGRTAVTFDEWSACVADGGCGGYRPDDDDWGGGKRPVINVSWDDAKAYVKWLSKKTGAAYRLLSEAEREYATRGCTTAACPSTPFWFGAEISPNRANYDWGKSYNGSAKAQPPQRTVATDASEANPFGLLQVHGNVREWVEDCWNADLSNMPRNGAARATGDCSSHVLRGGSWADEPKDLRSAKRSWELADERQEKIGFRVARTLRN